MVRVISEKLFSPPRSRHSSGETVDKELAARAVEVLSSLNSRRLELSDYESSSDSHWDSEVDIEGEGGESSASKDLAAGEERPSGSADILRKRKERRRERNKLSAQAYRVRRKEQTAKQQTVLQTLQEENTRLKSTVTNLEEELQKVRHSLRQRGYLPAFPPSPSSSAPPTPTPTAITTTLPQADAVPGSLAPSFGALCGKTAAEVVHPAVDNDRSHQQQISPVVDNFLFSKPLSKTPPNPPPSGAVHNAAPTATPPPAPFSFPPSPPLMGGAAHGFTAPTSFLAAPLPTISEKPDGHFLGHHQQHPKPPQFQQQQQQHGNVNANANSMRPVNANVINTNANVFGMYQNNNHHHRILNSNNQLFHHQTVPVNGGEGGACADVGAQLGPFKMCKV